jgi:hypothetical protein
MKESALELVTTGAMVPTNRQAYPTIVDKPVTKPD